MFLLKKIIDLVFYSNLWIALASLTMCWQTQYLLDQPIQFNPINGLILFSTLFLYAIHRLIGIIRLKDFLEVDRYHTISTFKNHIVIYAILAAVGGAYYFFFVSFRVQLSIIIPGLISLGYVIPFLSNKKRLRDLNHIKIFLISIVWAWVTVILPAMELNRLNEPVIFLMTMERALFVFAITLPFDIRDFKIDEHTNVKTLPTSLGVKKSIYLSLLLLALAFLISLILFLSTAYTLNVLLAMFLSYVSTAILIYFSDRQKNDYYFTGLMDGTMIFQFLLIFFIG